jgi:hypothetical protein
MDDAAYFRRVQAARSRVRPATYVCYRALEPLAADGRLSAPSWRKAPWTGPFGHIEDPAVVPELTTQAKMLWDDRFFYVGVDMEAPDVWATTTRRDEHLYAFDPDFEVFIDPDRDGLSYMEFGINAANCAYDFLLYRPYDRGGPRAIGWDWKGLRTGVQVDGTLNAPWIRDRGWSAVIAFDFDSMQAHAPGTSFPPRDGDVWRVNLSRLVRDRQRTWGKDWTWSCMGVYSMHVPELYGLVQFSTREVGTARLEFTTPANL